MTAQDIEGLIVLIDRGIKRDVERYGECQERETFRLLLSVRDELQLVLDAKLSDYLTGD